MTRKQLQEIARKEGTPVVVIDHNIIRANYKAFHQHLPRVQAYYAVKANPEPAIVRSLYKIGASFDVASLAEFRLVYENIKDLPAKEQQDFIWDKIIYANPTKPRETLEALDQYKPLVTFDNLNELKKIKRFAPHAGVVLRLRVPNTGSVVELSSKFGADPSEAVTLIQAAFDLDLVVEGLSFHVGSQCTNFENFVQALNISASVMRGGRGARPRNQNSGHRRRLPRPLSPHVESIQALARKINAEIDRLFSKDTDIIAEPGRFLVASAATSVAKIIGKALRDGKTCYYIDDGVYHTFSGIIFDHCQYHLKAFKRGPNGNLRRLRPDLRRAGHDLACRRICPIWTWTTWFIAKPSAPTAAPPPPGSTASPPPRWFMSTNNLILHFP